MFKYYGDFVVLKDVNVSIVVGEYFVLFGLFGGGKIILLCIIGGFYWLIKGEVLFYG